MKMKINLSRLAPAMAAVAAAIALTASPASATVNLNTDGIGYVTPTIIPPSGFTITYVDNMIGAYNGGSTQTISGETYNVVNAGTFGTLTDPTSLGAMVPVSGGPTSYSINLGAGGYGYLVADWDGPNGADAIYDIAGLTGTITLDITGNWGFKNPESGLSNYWLTNGGTVHTVPDAGATAMLMAIGIAALFVGLGWKRSQVV